LDSLKKCLKASAVRKALKSLPKTLDDTYARILLNIDPEYHQEAITALNWLAFSKRPLRIEELAEAVVINPQANPPFNPEDRLRNPHSILQILSSLVTISSRTDTDDFSDWEEPGEVEEIKLAHFSVKEYLTSDRVIPELSPFRITDVTANRAIAENSLLYIMSYDHAENKSSSDRDLEEFPLLQYACRFWHAHVITDQHATESSIFALIFKLFISDSGLSSWLQVCRPDIVWQVPFSNRDDGFALPLYYASYLGLHCVVKMLVDSGADVNAQGGDYGNALQAASYGGHDRVVQWLLEEEADVNAQGGHFGNALQAASFEGHDQIVQRLLKEGADVNAQGGIYGNALQAASFGGHDQIVQRLLEEGADVNTQGGRFGNALQAASIGGHDRIVQRLLEEGPDVNAQGGDYGNALQAASTRGHDRIVQRLLEKGAV
jgi:ankyrin repeat protein